MFSRQQPWNNVRTWVLCGKALKNTTFLFWGVIWVLQGVMMVPNIFSEESWILQLWNDVSHVFFGLLEQKLFRKTKRRHIKLHGYTLCHLLKTSHILTRLFQETFRVPGAPSPEKIFCDITGGNQFLSSKKRGHIQPHPFKDRFWFLKGRF